MAYLSFRTQEYSYYEYPEYLDCDSFVLGSGLTTRQLSLFLRYFDL
jgi:hypothetical protein